LISFITLSIRACAWTDAAGATDMQDPTEIIATTPPKTFWQRFFDSDVFFSYSRSPVTILASLVALTLVLMAVLAPWLAPHTPFSPASIVLMDGFTPPGG